MILNMIIDFINTYDNSKPSEDSLWWRQFRSIFTTYCIAWQINADTLYCDNILTGLYNKLDNSSVIYGGFENFMLADIV